MESHIPSFARGFRAVCGGGPETLGALAARCREPESWLRWARGGRGRIRSGTRLEQVHRRRRLRWFGGNAQLHWFGGNAQLHCCRARLRGLCRDGSIGGRMRGLRVRGVLEHAGGWCQQVGGCGKGTPRLAIIANQRASEPSEWLGVRRRGETANSSACWNGLQAGID
jgi:hypothetical protein